MNDHDTDDMHKSITQLSAEGFMNLIGQQREAADGDAECLAFLAVVECAIALALASATLGQPSTGA